ncbi:MAG: acyl-CoA dehydratase activase [Deltaproteobacteria bacterium]|jgi:predicted CoA-substrate-specific enzyme activase|nr:acyl-CoA dehydratase activase [Deltaproteobacteria bacterium]
MGVKFETALDPRRVNELTNDLVIGFDIGSRTGKAVLLKDGLIYTVIAPTSVFMQQTVDKLLSLIEAESGVKLADIDFAIGTGYGRIAFDLKDTRKKIITEITCHAMGAYYLNSDIQSIVDIGGQDAKAIRVDPRNGHVVDFIMNDKCAAGTGRFLEKVAELLGLTTEDLGIEALKATGVSDISSQCVVFAESEVISLSAKSEPPANIAAGIHLANARRVKNLFNRIGLAPEIMFSGGVAHNVGMKKAVEQVLGQKFIDVNFDAIYTGALGAAILAQHTLTSSKLDMAINI